MVDLIESEFSCVSGMDVNCSPGVSEIIPGEVVWHMCVVEELVGLLAGLKCIKYPLQQKVFHTIYKKRDCVECKHNLFFIYRSLKEI